MSQKPHIGMQNREDFERCATRLKALADPDRLRIVDSLLQGKRSVTQLAEELGEPIDKVSHHLGVLRSAQLVETERQGKFVIYSVSPDVVSLGGQSEGKARLDLGCCRLDLE